MSSLIQQGGYGVSNSSGKILVSCNLDTPYIPASILKIPTALAAFSILGRDYRFTTRFYTDSKKNLYIKGFGDPLLVSEEVALVLKELQTRGVERINAIYIDISAFALEKQVPGREESTNPYDAPVGPTVVNFNSVGVRVSKKGFISSNEKQTPTLPIMRELARNYRPGQYRLNVCKGCEPNKQMARFTAELFRGLQKRIGIPGKGDWAVKQTPDTAKLVYEHHNTKNLQYLASSFLKYSSNFITNLVYLACGAEKYGYPATWAKADLAVHLELVKLLGDKTAAEIVHREGAGLSRENRITVRAMLNVLEAFQPYRKLLRQRHGVLTKSGTMKGIYNYAGYLKNGNGYVIILNQVRNTRKSVLERLKEKY